MTELEDKTVYGYDPVTGEYNGQETARVCPVSKSCLIYPAHTTEIAPPLPQINKARVWQKNRWIYVQDNRGKAFYRDTDEPAGYINSLLDTKPDDCVFKE